MKNKGKTIFIAIYTILLLILPIGIIASYKSADGIIKTVQYDNCAYLGDEMLDLAYASAILNNKDYHPVVYTDDASQDYIDRTNELIKTFALDIYDKYYNDPNLNFTVTYNKVIRNNNKASDNLFSGSVMIKNDQNYYSDNLWNYNYNGVPQFIFNALYYDGSDQYFESIKAPNNLKLEFDIHADLIKDTPIAYELDSPEAFVMMAVVYYVIIGIISAILIFAYPTQYIEDSLFFKTIKNWKFEILAILHPLIIAILGIASSFGLIFTYSYPLTTYIPTLTTQQANFIVIIINYLLWGAAYIAISACLFSIKYIFYKGFIRYFKENTIVGSIVRWFKRKTQVFTSFDLQNNIDKTIIKVVLILGIILYINNCLFPFSFFILLFILIGIALFLKRKASVIQNNYLELLNSTKQLSEGNLDVEIDNDLGIFNSLKDALNNLKVGFKKAVEEETKSQNMKTELISNVSHDLKTPITCIKNYVYLLEEDNIDEETRKDYIKNLKQYTNRLTVLIEDLFEVSKANSGNITLNPEDLDIVALLEQSIAETEDKLSSKELNIIKHLPLDPVTLHLDGDKTYRIFENLLSNIGKYALPNSRVYIDIIDNEETVDIIFKNISQDEMNFTQEEIIERFVRGDKSRHESGSGLGLAIAKSFTEAQDGLFNINIDGDLFKVIVTFKKA